jgi:short-subunit dehydrogenase
MEKKVWFVTGASKGVGLALIKQLLAAGHSVAAASKFLPALVEAVSKTPDAGFLPLEFDAADEAALANSIRNTRETFGQIDTIVINAGYNPADPHETAAAINNILPWFRTQGAGHIIGMGMPALPEKDNRYPGIHLTTVIPGASQTQFPVNQDPASSMTFSIDGKQIGDPQKAAAALLRIAALSEPPTRLLLVSNAVNLAAAATRSFLAMDLHQQNPGVNQSLDKRKYDPGYQPVEARQPLTDQHDPG